MKSYWTYSFNIPENMLFALVQPRTINAVPWYNESSNFWCFSGEKCQGEHNEDENKLTFLQIVFFMVGQPGWSTGNVGLPLKNYGIFDKRVISRVFKSAESVEFSLHEALNYTSIFRQNISAYLFITPSKSLNACRTSPMVFMSGGWKFMDDRIFITHSNLGLRFLEKCHVILDFLVTVIYQSNPQNLIKHLCNVIVTSHDFLRSSISAYLFLLFALFPSIEFPN